MALDETLDRAAMVDAGVLMTGVGDGVNPEELADETIC